MQREDFCPPSRATASWVESLESPASSKNEQPIVQGSALDFENENPDPPQLRSFARASPIQRISTL